MATATPRPDFIRFASAASPEQFVAHFWRETPVSEIYLQNEILGIVLMCHRSTLGLAAFDLGACCGEVVHTLRQRAPMLKCRYKDVFKPFADDRSRAQALGTLLLDPPAWERVLAQLPDRIGIPSWFAAWSASWRRRAAKPSSPARQTSPAPVASPPVKAKRPRAPDAVDVKIGQLLDRCNNDPKQHPRGRPGFREELLKLPAAAKVDPDTLRKRILREIYKRTPATNLRDHADAD